MPERNRVTPMGDIVAIPLRGAWTGNRGIIHRGREIVRFHAGDLWITCALEFRGRWREQWLPHRWTHLCFHDEAVSLAAGHRPCAECRRGAYRAYQAAWRRARRRAARCGPDEPATARRADRARHAPPPLARRILAGAARRRVRPAGPAGRPPALVLGDTLVTWTLAGYGPRRPRPRRGEACLITPPSSVAALRAGYPVQIDATAR